MIEKTYNVGIYCRLSNDDERDGESVSIENQKLLLQSYVRQRGWNEIAVYCDDGYSGTNFDRPGQVLIGLAFFYCRSLSVARNCASSAILSSYSQKDLFLTTLQEVPI